MTPQLSIFDAAPALDIIDAHGLSVEVDAPRGHRGAFESAFVGDGAVDLTRDFPTLTRVHVMSPHARGEIRSYVMLGDGWLRLALPNHSGEWTELDNAVALRLGARVMPYRLLPGGMEDR